MPDGAPCLSELTWTSTSDYIDQKHFTILKVEAVEVCALHQVPQGFRFKGCETRITYLPERVQKTDTLASQKDMNMWRFCEYFNE